MARPELPGAAVPHSAACFSISVGGSHPLFQPPAKNALLFFVWLWYIGLGIVKAALKSSIFLFFLEQLCYFNLSPQGDGNSSNRWFIGYRYNFNLSPQGDGNAIGKVIIAVNLIISTYPRKGTETPAFGKVDPAVMDFNLSPQGDGNGILHGTLLQSGQIQLIPARGR